MNKGLKTTISFYKTVLGFTSKSKSSNFASLTRDPVEIMFMVPHDEQQEYKDANDKQECFGKAVIRFNPKIISSR